SGCDLQEPLLERCARGLESAYGEPREHETAADVVLRFPGVLIERDARSVGAWGHGLDAAVLGEDRERLLLIARRNQNRLLPTGGEICNRTLQDDLPSIDDRDLVADLLDLVEQVRGEED